MLKSVFAASILSLALACGGGGGGSSPAYSDPETQSVPAEEMVVSLKSFSAFVEDPTNTLNGAQERRIVNVLTIEKGALKGDDVLFVSGILDRENYTITLTAGQTQGYHVMSTDISGNIQRPKATYNGEEVGSLEIGPYYDAVFFDYTRHEWPSVVPTYGFNLQNRGW